MIRAEDEGGDGRKRNVMQTNGTRAIVKWLAVLSLMMACTPPVQAQLGQITLQVTKKVTYRRNVDTVRAGPDAETGVQRSIASGTVTQLRNPVTYRVEVANNSFKRVDNLTIRWTVLVHRTDSGEQAIEQGETSFSLDTRRKYACDVHPSEAGVDLVGCTIDLYAGDTRIATETEPPSVKARIEELRRSTQK